MSLHYSVRCAVSRTPLEILLSEVSTNGRTSDLAFNGTRKLVRPHLPPSDRRRDPSHPDDPLTHAMSESHASVESSHAEAFYFQKQIQQHTEMSFVLEDGEEIHGAIEWYDKCVIKVRSGRKRILIYKATLKYLYKSSEVDAVGKVMK